MAINYSALAEDYARYRRIHPGVLHTLLTDGGINPQSCVLEVGCGTGNYIVEIAEMTGCICRGVDASERMLEKARARTSKVEFELEHAEALTQPANDFDLVFSVDVIHHINDRLAYFHSAWRTLKPGGRICTVTDSESIIRNRVPLSKYFPETVDAELRRYPPISLLRAESAVAGFIGFREVAVEFPYLLTDCSAYETKAYSALHLIPQEAFERGITRMKNDLVTGPIACNSRYVLLWAVRPRG